MSPRVGMIAALIAAALLALAAAGLSWWSGHPTLDGKEFHRKTAHIGLIRATQCNFDDVKGEDYECKDLTVGGALAITKFVQLGITGLAVLSLLGLAFAGRGRKGMAKVVLAMIALSSVMAVVLLAMGPNLKTGKSEAMPLSVLWMVAFGFGTIAAFTSAVMGILPARQPRVRAPLPHPASMQVPMGATNMMNPTASGPQPAFDVHALLAEDSLRPAALGPEPMIGMPHSPGGMLPGPAGPLVPPSGPQPLFQSAPQLRPLYEAGASGGFVPPPPPVQFPVRGPTPMPQAAVSAFLENDPFAPPAAPPPPAPPASPKLPPPMRNKPPSVAPPIPAIPSPPPKGSKPPPKPTMMSAAVPPPSIPSPGDNTSPNIPPFDSSTSETATKDFQREDGTDVGTDDDNIETKAVDKVEPADAARVSKTEVELDKKRPSAQVMTSATPVPTRRTPVPMPAPGAAPAKVTGKVPITTAPKELPPPAEVATTGGPSPACPQCEAPMTWVEEHLRFYCKSCRMYF
jgi:hypothetical protein